MAAPLAPIVSSILGGLVRLIPRFTKGFIKKALVYLGIYTASYTGLSYTFDSILADAYVKLNGLPADILNIMGLLKVGDALAIFTSAVLFKLTLKLGKTGAFKKIKLK